MKRIVGLAAVAAVLIGPAPIAGASSAPGNRDPLDEARHAAETCAGHPPRPTAP